MVDVLDGGSQRPPLPRWVWLLGAGVAAVALIVVAVTHNGGHRKATVDPTPSSFPAPSSAPTPLPSPSPTLSSTPPPIGAVGTLTTTPGAEWPSAPAGCGDVVLLALRTLTSHYNNAKGVVLVGGHRLETVRLDRPLATTVPSLSTGSGMRYTSLAAGPHASYAQIEPCDPSSTVSAAGFFYRIDADGPHRLNVTGDLLVGGAHHAWAVRFPPQPTAAASSPVALGESLVPLDGGPTITLEPNAYLIADTTAGLVVGVTDPLTDALPRIELVDAATGRVVRTVANAYTLAAHNHDLVAESPTCGTLPTPTVICSLERLDLTTGRSLGTYTLPAGRTPVSGAVFSPDGRTIAFQLTEATHDPRFGTEFPPSDVAILHLDTGRLVVVPNLEFAPKTSVGLTFDANGSSLLVMIDQGAYGELLIWQEGMSAPALVVTVPGPFAEPPAVVLTQE
jgi:hypothetical protein